jgi:hypothetical protein
MAPSFPRGRAPEDPADKVNRGCLAQRELASSPLVKLCPAISIDHHRRKAGIRNKRQPSPFPRARHGNQCGRPCFCRSKRQFFLAAFRPTPGGGLRSTAAAGPGASALAACRDNRKLPHHRSSKGAVANIASRDVMTAHRLQERKRRAVVASNVSGSARIQLLDQSVEENILRQIDFPSRFLHRKEAGSIHFGKSLHFA